MRDDAGRFPDAFLVGAPKCGTTSVYEYFSAHPQIFVPAVKEPHFFSLPEVADTYYQASFVREEREYLNLYRDCGADRVAVDCSTSYLHSHGAAERIHRANPEARIIAVLREPTARALSHFQMDVRDGLQEESLERCLREPERFPLFHREYVDNGLYAEQVRRYLDRFGPARVRWILFEDLHRDTAAVMRGIFEFLEVKPDATIDFEQRANTGAEHRFALVKGLMKSGLWRGLRGLLPDGFRSRMRSLLTTRRSVGAESDPARAWLRKRFRDDIAQLEELIHRDLSRWREA